MIIAHNINAANALRQYNITGIKKRKSTEKLSSGYKINGAADDAARLSISEKMRKQIRGLDRGTENMEDGVSFLQIGDGAMAEAHDIIQRINELAVHGANGTLSRSDREAIDAEVQQLKTEIDRISETTKFNELRIFSDDGQEPDDNGRVVITDLGFAPADLKIFNASYDDATGDVTYGGVVFQGSRILWTDIDPNMVDMSSGTQKFHEGTWVYVDDQNRTLTISAKEGDEAPHIRRTFDLTADTDGLHIDGEVIPWEGITDEDGNSLTNSTYINGTWNASYHGSNLTFEVKNAFNGISGIIDAINQEHNDDQLNVYAVYDGSSPVQAVDADMDRKRVPLKNSTAQTIADMLKATNPDDRSYVLRADSTGLWLQDAKGAKIAGSDMTWNDLTHVSGGGSAGTTGTPPWESGSYINDSTTYRYSDPGGGTGIIFEFKLSDITSVDSVIDGLDMVPITPDNYANRYNINIKKDSTDPNIKEVRVTSNVTKITLENELALNRDFDSQTDTFHPDNGGLQYDGSTTPPKVTLSYGNGAVSFEGNVSSIVSGMESNLKSFEQTVISAKTALALAGADPNAGKKDLSQVLGSQYVSPSGTMQNPPSGSSLLYPAGWIDFSCLDANPGQAAAILRNLIGSGFDSTCGTCSRHYSFTFVDDIQNASQTVNGLKYKADMTSFNSPKLEIAISSLVNMPSTVPGATYGEKVANALLEITKAARFDDHFQKYYAEGSKFFVSESRQPSLWSMPGGAQFYTKPFNQNSTKDYTLNLNGTASPSNGSQTLRYKYDHGDFEDQIQVNMAADAAGDYVKNAAAGTYEKYDPIKHAGITDRYKVDVTYKQGTADDTRKAFIDNAVKEMIKATSATLNTTDYSRVDYSGDENANTAVNSLFRAYSNSIVPPSRWQHIKGDKGIQIQKSGDVPNRLMIPRFSINSAVLGLKRANCLTQGHSRNTIEMAARALECINVRRSLYGALQNCLEHALRSNENTGENTQAAESRLRDTDIAEEMVSFSRHSILEQTGQAMLAQARQMPQDVMSLLQ